MPATAAISQNEKRATSVAHTRSAQPSPSAPTGGVNKVRTRSAADAQVQAKAPSKISEARKFLIKYQLVTENAPCTAESMADVLRLMADTYKMPENVANALGHVAEVLKHTSQQPGSVENAKSLLEIVKEIQTNLSSEMECKFTALEKKLLLPSPAQKQLESTAKELGLAAECIKASTDDIGKSIAQVTDTSSQLASTATSYKDALRKNGEQQTRSQPLDSSQRSDPRLERDIERKTRQILVDTLDPKIALTSLAGIKEIVGAAIKAITNPPPPADTAIADVNKLRRGGFTVVFKDKAVIEWLQDITVELEFTMGIAPDASITRRVYSILVPRIPLTFDPTVEEHLREIEECNNLPAGSIQKARWIKPENRRFPGQQAAHAIFAIKDANTANMCLRDGLHVCGSRSRPSRLKQEPMQCMKCRRWGHFANACTAAANTCGTCGGEHRTDTCSNREQTFCVSCKSNEHASWSRECPDFRRRCEQLDENIPENNLQYFPTEEEWTRLPRPNKIQRSEKFPLNYAVAPLRNAEQSTRANTSKQHSKQRKQQGAKVPNNQATMDQFIGPGNPSDAETGTYENTNHADAAASTSLDPTNPYPYPYPSIGQEPHGWK